MEGRIDFSGILDGNVFAGSDVEITPTLSEGTKIADYEIDGVAGELYAPTGGGSTVEIEPTLSTGTKIADFEVDGVAGELYAPTGGGSTVDIDPTISAGTKIADFEVDGVSGELYAPTPITNYNDLSNKPTINNVTLQGDISINEVPDSSQAASGDVLTHTISGDSWLPAPKELPTYTAAENGKFLGVDNGILAWLEAGGSGGSGVVKLAESSTFWPAGTTVTLSDDINNYDLLLFDIVHSNEPTCHITNGIITVADFKIATDRFYVYYGGLGWADAKYVTDTSIYLPRVNASARVRAIYGIKIGSGGGSGSSYTAGYGIDISNSEISVDHYVSGDSIRFSNSYITALVSDSKTKMGFNVIANKPIESLTGATLNFLNIGIYDAVNDTVNYITPVINGVVQSGFNVTYTLNTDFNTTVEFNVSTVSPYPALNVDSNGIHMIKSITIDMEL